MHIYNTLSKKKEEFIPLRSDIVTFYMCGPTVYDYFHIGNARSFVMADIIRRYLLYKGFKVKFVLNLTDIDDKIIKKSIQNNKSAGELASFYIDAFMEDIARLKIKPADLYPRATENIDDMITIIKNLLEKGFAYEIDGNIFYNVSKFGGYGKLSGKKIEDLEVGARIEINEEKKDPLDFALWKRAKEGEPFWESPWGRGRPGWHIECSAMSTKYLGETIDIHAGGNDLIFPHHENEIAQSEAASGKTFVKYWIHFGFLNLQNEKMSKSSGNFFTAREVLARYPAEAIRLFFAQTHYGGPLNFSDELLAAAQKGFEKIRNLGELAEKELNRKAIDGVSPGFDFKKYYDEIIRVMDDDFNTSQGIAVVFDFVKHVNKIIAENENIGPQFYAEVKRFLKETAEEIFGICNLSDAAKKNDPSIEDELIQLMLKVRDKLKQEKNFVLADQIRKDLNAMGIELKDSREGTAYNRRK